MKHHIERGQSGKTLCGKDMPRDFNPWTSQLETCERCARIDTKRRTDGAQRANK